MPTSDLRSAYRDLLMDRAFGSRYPSPTMLDRIELELRDDDACEEYVRALIDLMSQEQYPSAGMMERVAVLISTIQPDGGRSS